MLLVHLMQSEREIIIPFYERHQNPAHQAPRFRNAYGHITCSRLSAGNPACSARYLFAAASRPLMRESSTPACAHPIASYMGIRLLLIWAIWTRMLSRPRNASHVGKFHEDRFGVALTRSAERESRLVEQAQKVGPV
jgi:hypothetical protein